MKQLIINVGPSGCGKTTWTTGFISKNPDFARINRDDIRKTLFGEINPGYYKSYHLPMRESLVSKMEDMMFSNLRDPRARFNGVIDNTNLQKSYLEKWIKLCDEYDIDFKIKIFDPQNAFILKDRVKKRDNIPSTEFSRTDYIDKQLKQYEDIVKFINATYKDKLFKDE